MIPASNARQQSSSPAPGGVQSFAPIALFVYNRPEHTRRTVDALRANRLASSSELHVFSDGPRAPQAAATVRRVRAYLRTLDGFASVEIHERESNFGLAESKSTAAASTWSNTASTSTLLIGTRTRR